jgi:putative tryptophan/tyrosine transport system substrate-binding protein
MKKAAVPSILVAVVLLAVAVIAEAQQPKKVPRIGYLVISSLSGSESRAEAFRQGLRELGYVEGKNIIIEWRSADGKRERGPTLAEELVRLKVEVIVTGGSGATRPAKEATKTIPIVMAQDGDPVGNGYVASLSHPGGNITGLSSLSAELGGKRLELLKEIVSKLTRAAVLGTSTEPGDTQGLKDTELAAGALGVKLQYIDVLSAKDIEIAFRAAVTGKADGILVSIGGPILNSHGTQIRDLAAKNRLPAIYGRSNDAEAGGLTSYSANSDDLFRRAATYVDKILKGAKPADLPVEQPIKFEFIINLKAAKQIGLTIPQSVLFRADKVIK